MSNLFSSFAPSSIFGLSLNWAAAMTVFVFLPCSSLFLKKSEAQIFSKKLLLILHLEFKSVLGTYMMPGTSFFVLTFFLYIFVNNFLGLFPYVFTASSHLSFALTLALPLWVGHVVYSWSNQTDFSFAHLVPKGTPVPLMSFMVIIELVSNLIRPLTLSVRLMANMTAGHLLLCLLSSAISVSVPSSVVLGMLSLIMLVLLEIAVSFIQAYVFTLLSTLYLTEVQTKTMMM